jgi:hypothetical protein
MKRIGWWLVPVSTLCGVALTLALQVRPAAAAPGGCDQWDIGVAEITKGTDPIEHIAFHRMPIGVEPLARICHRGGGRARSVRQFRWGTAAARSA